MSIAIRKAINAFGNAYFNIGERKLELFESVFRRNEADKNIMKTKLPMTKKVENFIPV